MKICSLLFVLIFSFSVYAQIRKPAAKPTPVSTPAPAPAPAPVEIKPTQKVVVEKTNGDRLTGLFVSGDTDSITIEVSGAKLPVKLIEITSLRFGEAVEPPKPAVIEKSALSIEAALVYQSGDVVPIARNTFYLLDDDVVTILKNAGIQPTSKKSDINKALLDDIAYLADANLVAGVDLFKDLYRRYFVAIEPHIVQKVTTDFGGKAVFNNLEAKQYFLFGLMNARKDYLVWNLPINVSKEQKVVIDQSNIAASGYKL